MHSHSPKGMLEIASEQTPHTDDHSIDRPKPVDEPSGRVRVFARTGFFVLYSVFKERHGRDGGVHRARPSRWARASQSTSGTSARWLRPPVASTPSRLWRGFLEAV